MTAMTPYVLLHGDVRDQLARAPAGIVQCCVTSPPYWGLRVYDGVDPSVWGGDPACDHEWGEDLPPRRGSPPREDHSHGVRRGSRGVQGSALASGGSRPQGSFCSRCTAWRGCLGNEPTPMLYVAHLVEIFRGVRRVLRDDGVVFLNLGDCFSSAPRGNKPGLLSTSSLTNPQRQDQIVRPRGGHEGKHQRANGTSTNAVSAVNRLWRGLKPKDQVGIPWMAYFALRDDGWYARGEIVWCKGASGQREAVAQCRDAMIAEGVAPEVVERIIASLDLYVGNGMPESTGDRPTRSHEYIFQIAKSERYFYDSFAIREHGSGRAPGNKAEHKYARAAGVNAATQRRTGRDGWLHEAATTRNRRSVWTIPTRPNKVAHFATFPPALVEPLVLAGTSAHGQCPTCGAPWTRVIDKRVSEDHERKSVPRAIGDSTGWSPSAERALGWKPTCACQIDPKVWPKLPRRPAKDATTQEKVDYDQALDATWVEREALLAEWAKLPVAPQIVLDPFVGSGTTVAVAVRLGRRGIGIDASAKYIDEIARPRLDAALHEIEDQRNDEAEAARQYVLSFGRQDGDTSEEPLT